MRGDWSNIDKNFYPPDQNFNPSQTISELPLKDYYNSEYQYFIRRTISKHGGVERKTLLELKYEDYDNEDSWICIAESYIMKLYYILIKEK